jgi:hypothetical protein
MWERMEQFSKLMPVRALQSPAVAPFGTHGELNAVNVTGDKPHD